MKEKKKPLYIPIKTLDSDDYIEGIGKLEIALIGAGICIGILLGIILAKFWNNSLVGVVTGIIVTAMSIGIFRRDGTNENLIRKITIIYRYIHAQKRYQYKFYNVFEHINIEEIL